VASRRILNGQGMTNGDFQLPPQIIKTVSQGSKKKQLVVAPPTGRFRYIAFDVRKKPFDNINVRKAIAAAFDRTALRQAFGGPATGDIPTHFIPPGQPGFDEAGGTSGPGFDFMKNPAGDMDIATANGKNILNSRNSNFANLNDPKINAAMHKAEVITDRAGRDKAWGEIDNMVTAQAPGVLWLWDRQPNLESTNVNGVINKSLATWDF